VFCPPLARKIISAPHKCEFTRFFRFAELLPIGAGSAKRNNVHNTRRRRDFFWDLGAFYTKITLLERIQERVSGVKHPQIQKKKSACGGPILQIWRTPLLKKDQQYGGFLEGDFSPT
jgi:hypothetical protein